MDLPVATFVSSSKNFQPDVRNSRSFSDRGMNASTKRAATGGTEWQAIALRDAMRVLFPEAVALVSAARQGFMREP